MTNRTAEQILETLETAEFDEFYRNELNDFITGEEIDKQKVLNRLKTLFKSMDAAETKEMKLAA